MCPTQYLLCSESHYHYQKQECISYSKETKQLNTTDPEMVHMLEDKYVKVTIINIFKGLKNKAVLGNKQIEESKWRNEHYSKSEILALKCVVFEMKIFYMGVSSRLEMAMEPQVRSIKRLSNLKNSKMI